MNKLYFKYGAMGSSKTAQALMCKFNYEQMGFNVILLKSKIDNRDISDKNIIIKSRIGLSAPCIAFSREENLFKLIKSKSNFENKFITIVDEAQFCTKEQINQLKEVSQFMPVLCYGLLTNFKTELFEGSKRLVEIADSLMEIKSVCKCGSKATVNARFINGKLATSGEEVLIGGNESYQAMCYNCYKKELENHRS